MTKSARSQSKLRRWQRWQQRYIEKACESGDSGCAPLPNGKIWLALFTAYSQHAKTKPAFRISESGSSATTGTEQCPKGHILVMDSRKDARAASAGDILITRLMMRGGAGVVTDGGFERRHHCRARYSSLSQPSISPTNLTLREAIDINVPIDAGWAVFPGDILLVMMIA